tara:strand:+ start:3396 stop:4415 length:1020 start_codon:yes stop_codon:yes gene_type:complete
MKKQKFNFFEKGIINFLLYFPFFNRVVFDFEKVFFKKNFNLDKKVFIFGLPRSGTSILLNKIYETNTFASLTYENMPFVMSPLIWRKISKIFIKKNKKSERMHGDRIKIDNKSPEAFDEVFWLTFEKKNFIVSDILKVHNISNETLEDYEKYVEMVCQSYNKKKYISKNNNNILRINKLLSLSGDNLFIIMYRDPLNHIHSLKKQFFNFLDLHKNNFFYQNYFNYLGHYEFGLTHKHYEFLTNKSQDYKDNFFWLSKWKDTYLYLKKFSHSNIFFLSYEDFCKNPHHFFKSFLDDYEINKIRTDDIENHNVSFKNENLSEKETKILEDCNKIYDNLRKC